MAVTFTTKASGDVTMLDAHAKQVLDLIGKDFGTRGVITAAEASAAAAKLRSAGGNSGGRMNVDQEKQAEDAGADTVPLSTRVQPFVEMLEASAKQGKDILWGV
jgi:hypothetical protein